jgi:hypothetical protein
MRDQPTPTNKVTKQVLDGCIPWLWFLGEQCNSTIIGVCCADRIPTAVLGGYFPDTVKLTYPVG